MKFWDSSAVVALLAAEETRARAVALLAGDPVMLVWWATPVECASAIARRERDGSLSGPELLAIQEQLDALAGAWSEVQPSTQIRMMARRLLRLHPLRAADALQLAAAVIAAEHEPGSMDFVCLDDRLAAAASREGFRLVALR
jgi:predicted nucleic acid-binding protein